MDTQRQHVYAAEQTLRKMLDRAQELGLGTLQVAGSSIPVPVERKFGDLAAVQTYVDAVLARVAPGYGANAHVAVRARKGARWAHYELLTQTIAIPPHESWDRSWAMRELVVLHEIAHHLTPMRHHDGTFVAAFLDLVETFMGPEAAFVLRVLGHQEGARCG
jgi:putative metallohydrolase (TIGR04338 family)